jgi:cytochrome c oxidase assembly factor CtaG
MTLAHAAEAGSGLPETAVLGALAVAGLGCYLLGATRLRAPSGRPAFWAWRSWGWRRWAFGAGVLVVVGALLPAFDPVVDASFPLHMVQHMVLLFVAAPLLALGAPGLPFLLCLHPAGRRRIAALRGGRIVRRGRAVAALPAVGVVGYSAVVLVWHLPAVYTAALESETVHIAEHACFLFAGWLLWAPLAAPGRTLDGGRAVLHVFLSGFPMSLVGAVLTLAPRPVYPEQTGTGPAALAAQQLAGVLMWIPPAIASLGLCAVLLLLWFRGMERAAPGTAPLPPPVPPPLPPVPESRRRAARRPTPTTTAIPTGEVPR